MTARFFTIHSQKTFARKVANRAVLCAAGLFLLFAMFLGYGSLPNRWYRILVVTSGSMAPTINPGDLIMVTRPPAVLRPGMVVTMLVGNETVTHRVVAFDSSGRPVTQGDANILSDHWDGNMQVIGMYRFRIPALGAVYQEITGQSFPNRTYSWFQDSEPVGFSIAIPAQEATEPPIPTEPPAVTPDTPTPEPTPEPSPTSDWDKSSLQFNTQGYTCDNGGIVWAVVQNTGEAMQGPAAWELYLDKITLTATGEIPPLVTGAYFTIQFPTPPAGEYYFKAYQRPAHPGPGELWSEMIVFDPAVCGAPSEPEARFPEPTVQPTAVPTEIPTEVPVVTETVVTETVVTEPVVTEPAPTDPPPTEAVPTQPPEPEGTPAPTEAPVEQPTVEPSPPVVPTEDPATPEPGPLPTEPPDGEG